MGAWGTYLDAASVKLHRYKVWTNGDNSAQYAGDGPWSADLVVVGGSSAGNVYIDGGTWTTSAVHVGSEMGGTGTVTISRGTWNTGPVLVGSVGSGNVFIRGADGRVDVNGGMLVSPGSGVTLDGGTLNMVDGWANFTGTLGFTEAGGTLNLSRSYLFHGGQTLALNGGTIRGTGEVFVGSAGVVLGSSARPGTIEGDPAPASSLSISATSAARVRWRTSRCSAT